MAAIYTGDCLEILKGLESDSVDSLVTDPPAGIAFMGKDWDKDKGGRDAWIAWMSEVMAEALRVLKPGAHGLVWAIPRTSHWTATALENAGFEVRDVVTHLFGSGFPKSMDISKAIDKAAGAEREVIGPSPYADKGRTSTHNSMSGAGTDSTREVITAPATPEAKQWQGFGTALKPASEHWILVRKPLSEKTVAKNVLKWGTGGLNIDGCRIETSDNLNGGAYAQNGTERDDGYGMQRGGAGDYVQPLGRFPANLVLDEVAAELLDEQSGVLKSGGKQGAEYSQEQMGIYTPGATQVSGHYGSSGGASRFFYVAKASKKDKGTDNSHPTVKSTKLMEYLIRLVTPPGGTVLDPFMGSGSTGVAALREGFEFVGVEAEQEYVEIATQRLIAVRQELENESKTNQTTIIPQ